MKFEFLWVDLPNRPERRFDSYFLTEKVRLAINKHLLIMEQGPMAKYLLRSKLPDRDLYLSFTGKNNFSIVKPGQTIEYEGEWDADFSKWIVDGLIELVEVRDVVTKSKKYRSIDDL